MKKTYSLFTTNAARNTYNRNKKTLVRILRELEVSFSEYLNEDKIIALGKKVYGAASEIHGALAPAYIKFNHCKQVNELSWACQALRVDSNRGVFHKSSMTHNERGEWVDVMSLPGKERVPFMFLVYEVKTASGNCNRTLHIIAEVVNGLLELMKDTGDMYIVVDEYYSLDLYDKWEAVSNGWLMRNGKDFALPFFLWKEKQYQNL